jgi:hypothetical protein
MLDRMLSVLVALSLALLVWLYTRSRDQEILDNVSIPVRVMLAPSQSEQYELELTGATQVMVSFSGSPLRIRELRTLLQRNEMHVDYTLTVPDERLHESRYSDTIHIDVPDIHSPPGVTPILSEERNRIPVTLHRLVERRLPVRFNPVQDEPVGPVLLEPSSVMVRGPQEVLDRVRSIPTVPSPLPTRSPGSPATVAAVARVMLVQELEGRSIRVAPCKISVTVPAQAHKKYELTDVPIQFLCPPNFSLRPILDERASRITLIVQGPAQEELPRVSAYVDLTRGRFIAGNNHEVLQVQLPRDFTLAPDPPRVGFKLVLTESVPEAAGAIPGQ